MAKTAKKKVVKITPAKSRRTRGDVVKTVAEATELKTSKVREVFDVLTQVIAADLGKGVGEFNFNGLMKWTYTPSVIDGKPASIVLTVTVSFNLK